MNLQKLAVAARMARTKWLESHGVPISQDFADFAEAIGKLIEACESEDNSYVAWLCYARDVTGGRQWIKLCDSDTPGAFKVYKRK